MHCYENFNKFKILQDPLASLDLRDRWVPRVAPGDLGSLADLVRPELRARLASQEEMDLLEDLVSVDNHIELITNVIRILNCSLDVEKNVSVF